MRKMGFSSGLPYDVILPRENIRDDRGRLVFLFFDYYIIPNSYWICQFEILLFEFSPKPRTDNPGFGLNYIPTTGGFNDPSFHDFESLTALNFFPSIL